MVNSQAQMQQQPVHAVKSYAQDARGGNSSSSSVSSSDDEEAPKGNPKPQVMPQGSMDDITKMWDNMKK